MSAPALLYLDTARLGQMSEMAQRLSTAFIRLSAEEPFSLYFEDFMRKGFASWPESYQRRFPDLGAWGGIESVRDGIRSIAGASPDNQVILASRSLWLVRSAARTAFSVCRRILTTDLSWPSYEEVLREEATRSCSDIHCVPIRHRILYGNLSDRELIKILAAAFRENQCDGIFLPAVDNLGVRLPIESIVGAIESRAKLRFVLTDAAQAIGHVPLDGVCRSSDFVVAGCHKWVRAYHPLGIGIVGTRRHESAIRDILVADRAEDPLFNFLNCLEGDRLSGHLETVNLTPLFSGQGAVQDLRGVNSPAAFAMQCRNSRIVRNLATDMRWNPVAVGDRMQSGIQLLKTPIDIEPRVLEQSFHEVGIRATVYEMGFVRLSLPARALTFNEIDRLRAALPMRLRQSQVH